MSGLLAGIAGSLMGQGASSALDAHFNRDAARYSAKMTRDLRQTAYQDTVSDLKKAGLNPMLSVSNGASNVSAISTQPGKSQFKTDIYENKLKKSQAGTAKAQKALLNEQGEKTYTEKLIAEKQLLQASERTARDIAEQRFWYKEDKDGNIEPSMFGKIRMIGEALAPLSNSALNVSNIVKEYLPTNIVKDMFDSTLDTFTDSKGNVSTKHRTGHTKTKHSQRKGGRRK